MLRTLVSDKAMSPYVLVTRDHTGRITEFSPLPEHRMYMSYLLNDGNRQRNAFLAYGNPVAAEGVREHFKSLIEHRLKLDRDQDAAAGKNAMRDVGRFLVVEEWDAAKLARACCINGMSVLLVQGCNTISDVPPFAPPTCYCHPSPDDEEARAMFREALRRSFSRRSW